MSIVIKELFSSDPLSEALEKINFNFDQVILAGGGPPGPKGDAGVQGISGPKGDDGTSWYTGASTPSSPLNGDHWLKPDGSIWRYNTATTTWINTGTNIKGSTGNDGNAATSYELKLYGGRTGGAIAGSNNSWVIEPSTNLTVDTAANNFLIPINAGKNSLFLGDKSLPYNNFIQWNNLDVITGAFPASRLTPKLTTIQNGMDYTGLGGIMFGAKGATSAEITTATPGTNLNLLGTNTNAQIYTRDFFNAGYYIKQPRVNNNPYAEKSGVYTHGFLMSMFTMDLDLHAGTSKSSAGIHANLGNNKLPSLNLRSYRIHLEDFDKNRTIYSNFQSVGTNDLSSYIEINSKPLQTNPFHPTNSALGKAYGYVALQTQQSTIPAGFAHAYGQVHIGPTASASGIGIANNSRAALNIVRPITAHYDGTVASSVDSHISLFSGTTETFVDPISRIIATRPATGIPYLQIQSSRLSIVPRLVSTIGAAGSVWGARFPLHVIQSRTNLTLPLNQGTGATTSDSRIIGGLAAFEMIKNDDSYASPGLSIVNYCDSAQNANVVTQPTDIGINTYWSNLGNRGNDPNIYNPHMYMQVGSEFNTGNLGIGFSSQVAGTTSTTRAHSKLAVAGSVTIGSAVYAAGNDYHSKTVYRPTNSLLVQGMIIRGTTFAGTAFSTDLIYTPRSLRSNLVDTEDTLVNIHYGASIVGKTISSSFIARTRQNIPTGVTGTFVNGYINTVPAYSLSDTRTGLDSTGLIGEGILIVNSGKNEIFAPGPTTSYTQMRSLTTARFSNRTDFNGLTGPGFQVTGRFATSVRYMNTWDFENLVQPYYGAIHRKNSATNTTYHDYQWEGWVLKIPTNTAMLAVDLAYVLGGPTQINYANLKYFLPHTYNLNNPAQVPPIGATNTPIMQTWRPPAVGFTAPGATYPVNFGLRRENRGISSAQYAVPTTTPAPRRHFNPYPNNLLVTLEDGLYDGQEFTLYIQRCSVENELVLTGHGIPPTFTTPWIIDDAVDPTLATKVYTGYNHTPIVMGLDIDQSAGYTSSATGLPYMSNNALVASTFDYTKIGTNWKQYTINNTKQLLVTTTGAPAQVFGDSRVTPMYGNRGAFRFRTARSITFKWCRTLTGRIAVGGTAIYAMTGGTSIENSPPPPGMVIDPVKREVAPVLGNIAGQGTSNVIYGWVEIGRTYPSEEPAWETLNIATL